MKRTHMQTCSAVIFCKGRFNFVGYEKWIESNSKDMYRAALPYLAYVSCFHSHFNQKSVFVKMFAVHTYTKSINSYQDSKIKKMKM